MKLIVAVLLLWSNLTLSSEHSYDVEFQCLYSVDDKHIYRNIWAGLNSPEDSKQKNYIYQKGKKIYGWQVSWSKSVDNCEGYFFSLNHLLSVRGHGQTVVASSGKCFDRLNQYIHKESIEVSSNQSSGLFASSKEHTIKCDLNILRDDL